MRLHETWKLSDYSNWDMINEYCSGDIKKRIDEIREEGISQKNEEEYWHLIGDCEVITSTNIKDGNYKMYHKTSKLYSKKNNQEILIPFKRNKTMVGINYRPYFNLINNKDYKIDKYYSNRKVKIREGKFDIKSILLAFDEIIIKSSDLTHCWVENLVLDSSGEIEIISEN
jgi:hypothetical protein|tara:strand:+ start:698 stop:1210 length:513 start_codon:yes stop_codon:yes gene_type:complete